jgi:hypothetical protein
MKVLVTGIFVVVGFMAGSLTVLFAGREEVRNMRAELQSTGTRTDSLESALRKMNIQLSLLDRRLESIELATEANGQAIDGLSQQLTSARDVHETAKVPSPGGADSHSESNQAARLAGQSEVVEALKEEVKKEIREEQEAEEREARRKWFAQTRERESAEWKKKIEDEFPKLAQKISLSPTQEYTIKDIAEGAFRQLMALMEEALTKPWEEVDWTAYEEKTHRIYEEAEAKIVDMVTEDQAKALREFFEVP